MKSERLVIHDVVIHTIYNEFGEYTRCDECGFEWKRLISVRDKNESTKDFCLKCFKKKIFKMEK